MRGENCSEGGGPLRDPLLENLDLSTIADERARECVARLLNLVEILVAEGHQLRAENQRLRDEVSRLKGQQGKPNIPPNRPAKTGTQNSSEKERREPKPWRKGSKNRQIHIDRKEKLEVDPQTLPTDAEFKGYESVVVQDLRICSDNVEFLKAKYYSRQESKTYLAAVPTGWEGGFGPGIKALAITFAYGCNLAQPKVAEWFANMGVQISAGEISNLLTTKQESFHAEKAAIYDVGLRSSPWQHLDATSTRVDGKSQYCHVVCNPLYSAYFTVPQQDRLSVLSVLRNLREPVYRINDEALSYLRQCGVQARAIERVGRIQRDVDLSEKQWQSQVEQHVGFLKERHRRYLQEAAQVAAYHATVGYPVIRLLVADDARQFKLLTEERALCWVHEGRHFKELEPHFAQHRQMVEDFLKQYWDYYRELLAYGRERPGQPEAERLNGVFDQLFSTVTGYTALDERIAQTQAKKAHLLMVLKHPDIPLHNNPAELAARTRARKRDVSFGPRSAQGAQCWDTFQTVYSTAKKLGVNFYQYICERIRGTSAKLPELIVSKAQELPLGVSWSPS
jgi:hypothetical protein